MNKNNQVDSLIEEILKCRKCPLWKNRKNPVPGEGPIPSQFMIIGEAPGKNEDIAGRPFVGRAGQLLTQVLRENGIERNNIFITNIVKCRPPGNRTPTVKEIKACLPHLYKQLELVRPSKILVLGRVAARFLANENIPLTHVPKEKKIEELRLKSNHLIFQGNRITVVVTYHPAAVLRNPKLLKMFKEDIKLFASI